MGYHGASGEGNAGRLYNKDENSKTEVPKGVKSTETDNRRRVAGCNGEEGMGAEVEQCRGFAREAGRARKMDVRAGCSST